jgi:hypothetical protein
MGMRQRVLWIGKWQKRGMCPCADPVPLDEKPDRVWTLYAHTSEEHPPKLPFQASHLNGAFLEDYVHDWDWRGGKFYYRSRVADRPVWVLLEVQGMKIDITDGERELLDMALAMRRCYIETGNPTVGAGDLANVTGGRSGPEEHKLARNLLQAEIRALSVDQMRLIVQIEDLRKKLQGG